MALVDVLIPGDDLFPPASSAGTHHWLLDKLREFQGSAAIDELVDALEIDGTSFADASHEAQVEAVRQLEADQPARFDFVRTATYYGYYQSPLVVRAIRRLGHAYNDAPQPAGYALEPFDPKIHLPNEPRGRYIPTSQVRRVDLSGHDL
jgi:hypothetical protein